MKICIREGYVDAFVLSRIGETQLKKEPYNFQIVEVPDDRLDCDFSDFDLKRKKYVFCEEKYQKRKEKENAAAKVEDLKAKLAETDYKAIKFAEGVISGAEYEDTKRLRAGFREEINNLEKIINGGGNEQNDK